MKEFAKRHIGWTLALALAISAISLYAYIQYIMNTNSQAGVDPFVIALQTVVSALCVGLVIVFIEKIGGKYSIEEKLTELRDSLADERDLIETRMDDIRERTENALQLKFGYGFTGVSDDPDELTHIDKLRKGRVRWLNTLFRNPQDNMDSVLNAVRRGIEVELLMMDPGSIHADVRGKYTTASFQDEESVNNNIEAYRTLLSASFKFIAIAYQEYKSETDKGLI